MQFTNYVNYISKDRVIFKYDMDDFDFNNNDGQKYFWKRKTMLPNKINGVDQARAYVAKRLEFYLFSENWEWHTSSLPLGAEIVYWSNRDDQENRNIPTKLLIKALALTDTYGPLIKGFFAHVKVVFENPGIYLNDLRCSLPDNDLFLDYNEEREKTHEIEKSDCSSTSDINKEMNEDLDFMDEFDGTNSNDTYISEENNKKKRKYNKIEKDLMMEDQSDNNKVREWMNKDLN